MLRKIDKNNEPTDSLDRNKLAEKENLHKKRVLSKPSSSPRGLEKTKQHLDDAIYVIFDIETTGGNPEKNGITEIFAIRTQKGKILDSFYSLVNPKIPVPPIVRRMTGINNRMLRDAPKIHEIMPQFVDFIADDILVSHNTIGDLKFLRYFAKKTTGVDLQNFFLCSHLLTEKLIPESPDKSLQGLAKFFGFESGEAHRAEADTYLTQSLFNEIHNRIDKSKFIHVEDVIRFQGDMDSGLRLGWAIDELEITGLESSPGVLHFSDINHKKLFLTSTGNLKQSFDALKQHHTLPKQLLKILLKARHLKVEKSTHPIIAMIDEAKSLENESLKVEPYSWHLRNIFAICILKSSNGLVKLKIGNIYPDTICAFGPIFDKKEAQILLQKIASIFDTPYHRKGLEFSEEKIPVLEAFLSNELGHFKKNSFKKFLSLKTLFSASKRKPIFEKLSYARELNKVVLNTPLNNLLKENGLLIIPLETSYESLVILVEGSIPKDIFKISQDLHSWLSLDSKGKNLLRRIKEIHSQKIKSRAPLSKKDSYLCKVALWMLYSRKGKLPYNSFYYSFDELCSKKYDKEKI